MSNPWVSRESSKLLFYKSVGVFALSNPCVSRDSSSLMISESLGAVWDAQSMRHP